MIIEILIIYISMLLKYTLKESRQGVDIIHFSDIKKEYLFSLAKLDYVDYDIEDIEVAGNYIYIYILMINK